MILFFRLVACETKLFLALFQSTVNMTDALSIALSSRASAVRRASGKDTADPIL